MQGCEFVDPQSSLPLSISSGDNRCVADIIAVAQVSPSAPHLCLLQMLEARIATE